MGEKKKSDGRRLERAPDLTSERPAGPTDSEGSEDEDVKQLDMSVNNLELKMQILTTEYKFIL